MGYSQKLNGFWEEGYHFYVEIRDEKITIRDYRRKVMTETTLSYDAEALERGVRTEITLANRNLSTNGVGDPMSWFEVVYFEDGQIHVTECYSFMDRRDPYVLKKVEHGPFDHIVIRDEEYLDRLQGVWKNYWQKNSTSKNEMFDLIITNDMVKLAGESQRFHVVSYKNTGNPEEVYLVPYDLTESDFDGFTRITVKPDMLTTRMMVCDMSMPLEVYAREDMLDKIVIPKAAKQPAVSVMTPYPPMGGPLFMVNQGQDLLEKMKWQQPEKMSQTVAGTQEQEKAGPPRTNIRFCPNCGTKLEVDGKVPKFCYNCGERLDASI